MTDGSKQLDILGVLVDSTRIDEVLRKINEKVKQKSTNRPFWITTINPEIVMMAQDDGEYKKFLNSADFAVADGSGLKLAGVQNVVPGRRIVEEVCKNHDYKIFFLGGRGDVSRLMAEKYGGSYDPGVDDIKSQILNPKDQINTNNQILNKINKFQPHVLFVAYGAPWQEKWIYGNLDKLKCKVVMGVGGSFDYLTGRAKLPPVWIEKLGLEWIWRLVQEPWRWRRQLNLFRFVLRIIIAK